MADSNTLQFTKSSEFYASDLFVQVQLSGLFDDSKTFADATPVHSLEHIFAAYKKQKNSPEFSLKQFVYEHFSLPTPMELHNDTHSNSVLEHIAFLWPKLEKQPDRPTTCSLLPLAREYVVPGGRFREIYYWDSYFTSLGLIHSGRKNLVWSMVQNFLDLQDTVGCIPNGNRSYYQSRSQPPVLSLMIELLLGDDPEPQNEIEHARLKQCIQGLEREYRFWMAGEQLLTSESPEHKRVVLMQDGAILNRYWDDVAEPRPESYREDIEVASAIPEVKRPQFYRDIRAACESGWDFSTRWLAEPGSFGSIRTTEILPVDLNCLLYKLETVLSRYTDVLGYEHKRDDYAGRAARRKQAINDRFWSEPEGFYLDFHIGGQCHCDTKSLAAVLPLFVGIASTKQSANVAEALEHEFLKPGGLITTLQASEQQWDCPNGWAPLQWFAVKGLQNYQYGALSIRIMENWVNAVEVHFSQHRHLMEKYNVEESTRMAQGGEYEVQHGFGWTNGVTQAFYKALEDVESR